MNQIWGDCRGLCIAYWFDCARSDLTTWRSHVNLTFMKLLIQILDCECEKNDSRTSNWANSWEFDWFERCIAHVEVSHCKVIFWCWCRWLVHRRRGCRTIFRRRCCRARCRDFRWGWIRSSALSRGECWQARFMRRYALDGRWLLTFVPEVFM